MGLLPRPLPCHKTKESQSQSYSNHLQSESSNSLSSQSSLPSISSLTSSFQQQEQALATLHQCLATLKGNPSYISSLAVTGKFLCSGSSNSEIRAWIRDPFVKASWDRTFKIWRTFDFGCLQSVKSANDDAINATVVSNDGFVYTCSADKKIKVWKKHAGEKKHSLVSTLEKHKSAVNALALSIDGAMLYSGACDGSILVWERNNNVNGDGSGHMDLTGALRGHSKAILCLAVVSNLVCSGSADNTVRIWRRSSTSEKRYSCLTVLERHRKPIKCLTVVVDSDNSKGNSDSGASFLVYSGSLDCDIKIWKIWVPNH